jgi:hypothetical protein
MKSAKIDAAHVTADTSVDARHIEPPIVPLDSALKNGIGTMLWLPSHRLQKNLWANLYGIPT